MGMAAIYPPVRNIPMPISFVYEDLVSKVIEMKDQMNQVNQMIGERSTRDKKVQQRLASRSFVVIDPFGNRFNELYLDHWTIHKVVQKLKKEFSSKYLDWWIHIGLFKTDKIYLLTDDQLRQTVSEYPDKQEFIAFGQMKVLIINSKCQLLQERFMNVTLNDKLEKLQREVLYIREEIWRKPNVVNQIELKVCQSDLSLVLDEDRWNQGNACQLDKTILSARLYQSGSFIMAKIVEIGTFPVDEILQKRIFIENFTDKTINLRVDLNKYVLSVKLRIEAHLNIPPDQQRLIFAGQVLEDDRTLIDYGIQDTSTLHLILRVRGEMPHFTKGRQDFSRFPPDCVKSIQNILQFKSNKIASSSHSSLYNLQQYSIEVKVLLSSLHSAIKDFRKPDDVPNICEIISPFFSHF